jgi:hypothetical protein
MGAVYAGLLLERSDAFSATTPHHQIVHTVRQITSSLGHLKLRCAEKFIEQQPKVTEELAQQLAKR